MTTKNDLEKRMTELVREAGFHKALKNIFNTPDGVKVFDYILALGNFGGVIKGDFDCGRYYVSSQIWTDVMKSAPDVAKAIIDLRYNEVKNNRQKQFEQLENQLKEVEDE